MRSFQRKLNHDRNVTIDHSSFIDETFISFAVGFGTRFFISINLENSSHFLFCEFKSISHQQDSITERLDNLLRMELGS